MAEEQPFPLEDWWSEWQVQIVQDRSRVWELRKFECSDGFLIKRDGMNMLGKLSQHEEIPPDAEIQENAWDHEHCCLCFAEISGYEGSLKEGYTGGKDWICPECYHKYIEPRQNR